MVATGGAGTTDENSDEGECDTVNESSSVGETDEAEQERVAVELYGNDNGEEEGVPENGLIHNEARCVVHRAHVTGTKSCCGWSFRSTAAHLVTS